MTQKEKKKSNEPSYHHGALKESLVAAALKILKTKSPTALSLRELAAAAGVSQTAPYRHFKNKEQLFAAIAQEGFEIQSKFMLEAFDDFKDDALGLYVACGLSYFKMGLRHPQHFKLMFGTQVAPKENHPEFMVAASQNFVLLKNMIQKCQKSGIVGKGDPYHKAMNYWCVVHGFTNLYAERRFEWLGMTSKTAELALKDLLLQYLDGNKTDLQGANQFTPFQTEYSAVYKTIMDKIQKAN